MYTFGFEKLDVWKKSRIFTRRIYQLTRNFPDEEKFGIVSQLRRAAISICSNLAEGSSRNSKKDQAHFYNIAFSSLMEALNQIILGNDLDFINMEDLNSLRNEVHTISLMLNRLAGYANRS